MLPRLARLFAPLWRTLTGEREELSARANQLHSSDVELRQVLEKNLGSSRPLMAGTIQLVSIGGIKEQLGTAWPELSDRARSIAEQEIVKELVPPDVHKTVGDDSFVLCFSKAEKSEAEAVSAVLSERIRTRLRDEIPQLLGKLAVDEFTTEVDSRAILERDQPMGDALFAALMKVRSEADVAARSYQSEFFQDARIIFQPVWDVAGARSSFNRCLLAPGSSADVLSHLKSIAGRRELADAVAQLDCLLLTRGLESLHRTLQLQAGKPKVIIPVQFGTLSEGGALERYSRLLELLPLHYRQLVGLEVQCVPTSANPLDVIDAIELVKPHVAMILLKLPPDDVRIGLEMQSLLWGLSLDLGEWRDTGDDIRSSMMDFVGKAKVKRLRTLAYGANTFGLAQAARDAGVSLIGGSAIHLNSHEPKPPAPLNPHLGISDMDLAEHHWRLRAAENVEERPLPRLAG